MSRPERKSGSFRAERAWLLNPIAVTHCRRLERPRRQSHLEAEIRAPSTIVPTALRRLPVIPIPQDHRANCDSRWHLRTGLRRPCCSGASRRRSGFCVRFEVLPSAHTGPEKGTEKMVRLQAASFCRRRASVAVLAPPMGEPRLPPAGSGSPDSTAWSWQRGPGHHVQGHS